MLKHVLIVEDDLILQVVFSELLSDEGFRSSVVDSVDGALAALDRDSFAAILLDMQLGDRSGVAILEALALRPDGPVVVAISASPRESVAALRFGVPFVAKPFLIEAVLAALAAARRPTLPP
jgi:DNA-binding response OmpR family regulator